MIVLIAALAGAFTGAAKAKRRKGTGLDMLQYGAVYAIAFSLLGLIVTIFIERML